jgi:hypothetical protein
MTQAELDAEVQKLKSQRNDELESKKDELDNEVTVDNTAQIEELKKQKQAELDKLPDGGIVSDELTPEEKARKQELIDALSQPDNGKGTVTIGNEIVDKKDAEDELDVLLKIEDSAVITTSPEADKISKEYDQKIKELEQASKTGGKTVMDEIVDRYDQQIEELKAKTVVREKQQPVAETTAEQDAEIQKLKSQRNDELDSKRDQLDDLLPDGSGKTVMDEIVDRYDKMIDDIKTKKPSAKETIKPTKELTPTQQAEIQKIRDERNAELESKKDNLDDVYAIGSDKTVMDEIIERYDKKIEDYKAGLQKEGFTSVGRGNAPTTTGKGNLSATETGGFTAPPKTDAALEGKTPTSQESNAEAIANTEQQKQKELENKVKELEEQRRALRSEDGTIPADKISEFKRLGEEINKAKDSATRGNSENSMLIKTFPKGGDTSTTDPEILNAEIGRAHV